ncbi:hypothetical protein BCR33DRAFT_714107 [Rhizoclosmatium globosum]|uniref:Uncharacterized protein n=1 Tax=Rhizoclosmatium globosum TaxID=329046 RepID=A0A1Y2CQ28_9FUNG|nr:hypothetical protein BCR33DRAFT_714107 [Rhizoclosmatium globosum]|eukprot:ORY49036.1 hypothetical protein BCR33DRAFT_714107 [Rhizoclosmatium globosum]
MERPRPRFPDPSVTAAYTHCLVCLEYTQRANERVPGHSLHNAALLCPSRNDVAAIDRALELAVLSNYSTPKWRQVAVEKLQSLRQRAGELGGNPFVVEEVQGEPQLYHEPMKARFNEAWVASEVDELTHELDGLDIVNPRNKTYAQVEVSCRPDAVGLTATDIAGYFHFGCDLALRLTRDKRREVDIPPLQPGVLTEALFKRGNEVSVFNYCEVNAFSLSSGRSTLFNCFDLRIYCSKHQAMTTSWTSSNKILDRYSLLQGILWFPLPVCSELAFAR